jgi:hypothetical protein
MSILISVFVYTGLYISVGDVRPGVGVVEGGFEIGLGSGPFRLFSYFPIGAMKHFEVGFG